ncbi:MAG TPA: hypothetical protein VH141_01610 [Pseudonocardia sp.]|jgi:hypothetical protein|nr:hypothetical protein [Pseudonocardia sp.]
MSVYRATLRVATPVAAALVIAGISMPAAWANPGPPPGPHPAPHPAPAPAHPGPAHPAPAPVGVRQDQCTGSHGRIVFDDPRNTRGPRHCEGGNWNGRKIN